MDQLIGGFKEFIVIEREVLNGIKREAEEMLNEGKVQRGLGMLDVIEAVKENNIYNKEFKIKH
jgi:hypothetical protein